MTSSLIIPIAAVFVAVIATLGGVWALSKQQVIVDQDGNASEIEIPFFGKLKTNYPSLVAIIIGAGLTAFVVSEEDFEIQKVQLVATLSMEGVQDEGIVFVGALPERYIRAGNNFQNSDGNVVTIEVDEPDRYSVIAYTISEVRADGSPVYSITHGPAIVEATADQLSFTGVLRKP